MTTIINSPTPSVEGSDSGANLILGVLIAVVLIVIFFVFALPMIRNDATPKSYSPNIDVNVKLPTPAPVAPQTPAPAPTK